ncbi:hypothetical protein EMEDMD4_460014 [Sinorhizobium medicae]|uniref:Uncharacterized protein n=1 Tax=Sinorhizobium medicae TaxID=110321 RepID=A0A508X4U6_9HYPH|nr:hypothetical protein EMEDMD4_460014 [Sinorhizobium medicae]
MQVAGKIRTANGDANTVAAFGKRAHHMTADKSGSAENRHQRRKIGQGHEKRTPDANGRIACYIAQAASEVKAIPRASEASFDASPNLASDAFDDHHLGIGGLLSDGRGNLVFRRVVAIDRRLKRGEFNDDVAGANGTFEPLELPAAREEGRAVFLEGGLCRRHIVLVAFGVPYIDPSDPVSFGHCELLVISEMQTG